MFIRTACLALSLFAFSAYADTLGKTMDGKIVYCQADSDVGTAAYRPGTPTLATQASSISLTLATDAVVCLKANGQYAWAPRSFTADYQATDLDGNPELLHFDQLAFTLIDQKSDLLGNVAAQNVSTQTVTFSNPIQNTISADDWKTLQSGQTITVHWEFFMSGVLTVTDANGVKTGMGQRSGGSYEVVFGLTLVNGVYYISQVL